MPDTSEKTNTLNTFIKAKYDLIFKQVFLNSENFYLLESLLSRILRKKVIVTRLRNVEMPGYNKMKKTKIMDFQTKQKKMEL